MRINTNSPRAGRALTDLYASVLTSDLRRLVTATSSFRGAVPTGIMDSVGKKHSISFLIYTNQVL